MDVQIHMVGNRAHLSMQGRHLCSQHPVMWAEEEGEESLNKEITPRPFLGKYSTRANFSSAV